MHARLFLKYVYSDVTITLVDNVDCIVNKLNLTLIT